MKKYNLKKEGDWVELVEVSLTNEQRELLTSTDINKRKEQEELRELLIKQGELPVNEITHNELMSLYNTIKPVDSELVMMNVVETNNGRHGVLLYKKNGEYNRVRF